MTTPLWVLTIFVVWTLLVLLMLLVARTRFFAAGGSHKDFAKPDSSLLIYRLQRAHINCVENLPLYIGAVVIIVARDLASPTIDILSIVYIFFRLAQSLVHILNINPTLRFGCLLLQIVCLFGLLSIGVAG